MLNLLNLLSAVALLIWGTHIVRTGVLRVYGTQLRRTLNRSVRRLPLAFVAGIGVTALVQSSNATALLTSSFVSQGLVSLSPALAIMLGADVGTALMARVLTLDLSWLSPLLVLAGVVLFLGRKQTRAGQLGRVALGLGLILLALEMIVAAVEPIIDARGVHVLFASLTGDVLLDTVVGALFAMLSYSSLAAVLLTATLAAASVISLEVALCLVIGANIGSGLLAYLGTAGQPPAGRRVALGSLLFKAIGLLLLPFLDDIVGYLHALPLSTSEWVIGFHLGYNVVRCLLQLPLVPLMARLCERLLPDLPNDDAASRPRHLDPSALDTPGLALANAVRETLRMGDVVEQMLEGLLTSLRTGDRAQRKAVRRMDDDIDTFCTAIKLYLARIPREDLSAEDSERWAQVFEMAINLERAGDTIERMLDDLHAKTHGRNLAFSETGMEELARLQQQLVANLRLGLAVFMNGDIDSAKRLRRAKQRFRMLERRYAHTHADRLHQRVAESIETSSLHLDLMSDMRRLNSLFSNSAHAVLELGEPYDVKPAGSYVYPNTRESNG